MPKLHIDTKDDNQNQYNHTSSTPSPLRSHFPLTPPTPNHIQLKARPDTFSFAAAGWLKLYLFGVASYLQDVGLDKKTKFVGSSAGSLTAAGLVLGVDFRAVRDYALECVEKTHGNITAAFRLHNMVDNCLNMMVDEKAHERLNGRLEVSVTALPFCANRRYKHFTSAEDFRAALLASCRMAPIAGLPFRYRGEYIFDGGLSDFQPMIDEHTITVSPLFFANADIRPSRYVPPWWSMYPPRKEDFEWLFDLGYHDAKQWAKKSQGKKISGNRPPMQMTPFPKPSNMSFQRFWGYRSIFRIVPSWCMTLLLGMFFILLIRPISMVLIYVELFFTVVVSCTKSILYGLNKKKRTTAWNMCKMAFGQLINPILLIRGLIPGASLCCNLDKEALLLSSVLYRVAVHYL